MEMNLSIPFETDRLAEIAYNSLIVDGEPARSLVKKQLSVTGNSLTVNLHAKDARSLRVSVNNLMEHIVLVAETMKQFGPPLNV